MGGFPRAAATFLFAALLSTPALAKSPAEIYEEVVAAGEILAFGTNEEKVEAASSLAGLRAVYSVPVLVTALGDPSSEVRLAAVKALSAIRHASAAQGLGKALWDEDETVATAAAAGLGDMHTDEAYSALISAVGKAKGPLKKAVLDGLRKWNEPSKPLPKPVKLPPGKEPPPLPGEDLPVKKKPKSIDTVNPYGDKKPGKKTTTPAPKKKSTIDVENPYGDAPVPFPAPKTLKSKSTIDKDNPYAGLEPVKEELGDPDTWGVLEEVERSYVPPRPAEPAERPPPPHLSIDLLDLTPSSFVSFGALTASLDAGQGRMMAMQISGAYSGRRVAAGATVPFAGGTSDDNAGGFEEWIFGNLGLWVQFQGSKAFERFTLQYGGRFTLHVPSGDGVEWSHFGRDPDFLPAVSGLYANYYEHGLMYPDLEDSFKISMRPDFALAFLVGRLAFQLELGFDFLILGKVRDADMETWKRDLDDLVLFHFGLGASGRPIDWLQLSLELTAAVQASGTSVRTFRFNEALIGDSAGTEIFITPAITALIPAGRIGSAHVTLGLRVPLGEIGSSSGPFQMGPIVLVSTGFRWTTP